MSEDDVRAIFCDSPSCVCGKALFDCDCWEWEGVTGSDCDVAMTREEYLNSDLKGWHGVRWHPIDRQTVEVKYYGDLDNIREEDETMEDKEITQDACCEDPAYTPVSERLMRFDISGELWREYEMKDGKVYRINEPEILYLRPGGSTHRVLDSSGIVHCLPGPGYRDTVLRWKSRYDLPAVQF